MILEICTNSFESALAAQKAGAHRIELCTALSLGGLTPSYGLLEKVMDSITIPVMVLIRPRSGNFSYSNAEWNQMERNIALCKKLKVAGIVCGALNSNQEIDIQRTQALLEMAEGLDFTFHRAFDWTPDPLKALQTLIDLKVPRLLSSGQEKSAEEGMSLLQTLQGKAEDQLEIMPGGGINNYNVLKFKEAGFKSLHASASEKIQLLNKAPKVSMEGRLEEGVVSHSSKKKIKEILKKLA